MIRIIDYTEDKSAYIKELNYEWLQKYFAVEPSDELQLSNPKKEIIDKGGYIYYATFNDQIVGTATLLRIDDDVFELGKMAVTEAFKGKGISKVLMQHCIEAAIALHAKKLILYSNTRLTPAIQLYRKFGFTEVPLKESHYVRSDIMMEKVL